jgi:UDP-2,3-diacylglucosamine hydrolase
LHALVVSDLHIDAAHPAIGDRFMQFLEGTARRACALYVLGDLFETWIGDDEDEPHRQAVLAALKRLTDAGVELYCMAGNRDFLYGPAFERATGGRLLADPTLVTRFGRVILFTHGDALCTDDMPYQRLRAMVRDPAWQQRFLTLPRATRTLMASAARSGSQSHTAQQSHMLMDVNQDTVLEVFRAAGVDTLLHGHTHRPGEHAHAVETRICTRLVLSDWSGEPLVARWDGDGIRLITLRDIGG